MNIKSETMQQKFTKLLDIEVYFRVHFFYRNAKEIFVEQKIYDMFVDLELEILRLKDTIHKLEDKIIVLEFNQKFNETDIKYLNQSLFDHKMNFIKYQMQHSNDGK